jgi:hypothetical protein
MYVVLEVTGNLERGYLFLFVNVLIFKYMKDSVKFLGVILLVCIFALIACTIEVKAQSITKTATGYSISMSDEEKAIKASVAQIKAKTNYEWSTNLGTLINWKIEFFKEDKRYVLYKNKIKDYESTTISGIKSKYASDMLGREVTIQ